MKSPGKIYLADQSGFMESSIFQRYSTFNYEKYYNEDAEPFGDLFLLNDDTIAGGKLTFFLSKADSLQIFIPITGGVDMVSNGKEYAIKTGQVQVLNMGKGEVLEISNPHPNDTINYIQIGIRTDLFLLRHSEMLFNFDIEKDKNKLIEIVSNPKLPFKLSAGVFSERQKAFYKMKSPESSFYAFIIDGAFEIEGRLLKRRDGLALFDTEKVQLVAMDNNSWVFVLELFNPF
ncbi:hypothetical protein [Pedobacter sp. Leaf176]|uniref:pirin family protein n=1 Tax=Pedobacter sp. Leaf176 TaxID=1736286 RepID=UPI0006F2AB4C|nr:hypothetical protein [Pedobacter sp. Leaf176]KQR69788.1 hypothetical protein ASF92_13845 [Pedobacter sp. Leaf176]